MNQHSAAPVTQAALASPLRSTGLLPRLRRGLSVRRRMALLVIGSALLILGVTSLITYRFAEDIALQEVRARAEELAHNIAQDIDSRLVRLSQSAASVAALDTALGQAGERDFDLLHRALREIAERELDFLNVYIFYDRQVIPGREYAAVWETRVEAEANFTTEPFYPNLPGEPVYNPDLPIYDYFEQNPRFKAAREAGKFVWTDVFRDVGGRPGNVYVTAGVTPLYDADDRFIGVAGVDLQFGQIRTYIAGVKPTANAYALLLDRRGTLISHARDTLMGVVGMSVAAIADQAHSEPLKRLGDEMVAGRRGVMELTDPLTNEDIFATYAPIEEIGWSIGLMIPRADLLGRVNDLRGTLLGLTVVSLLALGGISLLLGETVVRPLIRLTETARQVAAGDLHRVAAVERHDEIGILAVTFNAVTARLRELIGSLEAQVEARTAQLRASAGVGRAAASILEPDQLLREVVNLIAERFGFYYAAVFTLDETGAFAMLREGTGEAGRLLKERGHKLEVGGESMVGYVTAQRKPRVAMDAGAEAIRFANPLLPGTRSEIALPLVVGESVLGALDVQSTQAAAFDEASIAVLQSMADQIAVALSNAQSFESVQEALQSTTRMYVVGRTLFAATSRREAYVAMSQAWAALRDLDRFSILMMSEHDLNGNPTEYEIVAEWNVIDGMQLEPGTRCTPGGLPLLGLVESDKVVVAGAGDVRLPEAARAALEKAGATAAVLIPIVNRGRFEGLMMAMSQQVLGVRENDVRFMQSVVEQFAVVLGSLRAGEETRAALARVELLNRQLSGEAWRNYLAPRMGGLAVESGQLELEQAPSRVAAPVVVRGETLGMLELEDADAERQWSEDEWDLLNTVAGELAQAIENARLIEQAQQRAAREAQLNQIAHKIRRATDVESILHVAAEELGLALDTSHANIRLGPQTALTRRRHGG